MPPSKVARYKCWEEIPDTMTMPMVAKALGCSLTTAYGLLKAEGFPYRAICNRVYVEKKAFYNWIEMKLNLRR